jgi:RNA polymerase sigma-70 factor, ECF subfamily
MSSDCPLSSAIVRVAASRDPAAWSYVVTRCGADVFAIARRIIGRHHSAEDVTQETFLALRDSAQRFVDRGDDSHALAWVKGIACNRALHAARSLRATAKREQQSNAEDHGVTSERETGGRDPLVSEQIRRSLATLNEQHRRPLALHFYAGLDYPQLAEQLGCSVNTARVRVHRALKRLGSCLLKAGVTSSLATLTAQLEAAGAVTPSVSAELSQSCVDLLASPRALPPAWKLNKGLLMKTGFMAAVVVASISVMAALRTSAADVPAASAPTADEATSAKAIALDHLNVKWAAQVSRGRCRPIVTHESVLFTGEEQLACLNKNSGALRWSIRGPFQSSQPGIFGDSVIALHQKGVQCLALENGHVRWKTDLAAIGMANQDGPVGNGHWINGSENDGDIIVRDDVAFVGTRTGHVICMQADTGAIKWTAVIGGEGIRRGDLKLLNGRLLMCNYLSAICLDAHTGAEIWRVPIETNSGIGCSEQVAFIETGTQIAAIDIEGGKISWNYTIENAPVTTPTQPGPQSIIIDARDFPKATENIVAGATLSAQRWNSAYILGSPYFIDGMVVFGTTHEVIGLNARTGAFAWSLPCKNIYGRSYTSDPQQRLFASNMQGELLSIDVRSGKVISRLNTNRLPHADAAPKFRWIIDDSRVVTVGEVNCPALDGDVMYVQTSTGWALALEPRSEP